MELNSNIIEFLNLITNEPHFMVFGAAFGIPLFMFAYAMTLGRIYRNTSFSSTLNTVIFTTLGITWLMGTILMLVLFFTGISGIKLFIIWILVFVFISIFVITNFSSVNKFLNEQVEVIKQKAKK